MTRVSLNICKDYGSTNRILITSPAYCICMFVTKPILVGQLSSMFIVGFPS